MKILKKYLLKITNTFHYKQPFYLNWWLYPLVLLIVLLLVFGIPIFINELYKNNSGYMTLWEAKDVLSYYATILSGIITVTVLAVTLNHNRNMLKNQIIFNRAQTKQPFFIIDKISLASNNNFVHNGGTWNIYYYLLDSMHLNENDNTPIIIKLKNIGDGPAVSIAQGISMYCSSSYYCLPFLVKSNSSFEIKYNIQKNIEALQPKIKALYNMEDMEDINEFDFFTKIEVSYENILGVKYNQTIQIIIEPLNELNKMRLTIEEISPQTILLDTNI